MGVLPKCLRNVRLKCDKSLKPAANAMALMVQLTMWGSKSIPWDSANRFSMTNFVNDNPSLSNSMWRYRAVIPSFFGATPG